MQALQRARPFIAQSANFQEREQEQKQKKSKSAAAALEDAFEQEGMAPSAVAPAKPEAQDGAEADDAAVGAVEAPSANGTGVALCCSFE